MTRTEALRAVWEALWEWEDTLPYGAEAEAAHAEQWDNLCHAMAIIHEELGVPHENI